jgi:hypothetical protein
MKGKKYQMQKGFKTAFFQEQHLRKSTRSINPKRAQDCRFIWEKAKEATCTMLGM